MTAASAGTKIAEQPGNANRFRWLIVAIFLLALSLRLAYFFGARVDYPIRGDIIQYVSYAWNMVNQGIFSSATPGAAHAAPDAFRGPGYPAFLAIWMWLVGADKNWYIAAVMAQLVIGALLAPLSIAWTRIWLPRGAALSVGFLVALWPHAVVLSSTLLSETIFCAALLLFLVLASLAERSRSVKLAALAGLAGGVAYLINPVAALFPPAVAALLLLRKQRRIATAMIVVFALLPGAWAVRNAVHPGMQSAGDRAATNFVEGSWPQFHAAYNAKDQYETARDLVAAVAEEDRLVVQAPRQAMHVILERMSYDPGGYARWYLLEKPYSLWGWWIEIGWGDVYYLQTSNSPFDRQVIFRAIHESFRYANPAFFGLAVLAAILSFVRYRKDDSSETFSLVLAAGFFLYVTAVHTVLQAEPRYAVAYRPMEVALAVTACLAIWRCLVSRRLGQRL